jgi:hypothetical protein
MHDHPTQRRIRQSSKPRHAATRSGPEPGGALPVSTEVLLSLQSTAGNRAVSRLVQRWRGDAGPDGRPPAVAQRHLALPLSDGPPTRAERVAPSARFGDGAPVQRFLNPMMLDDLFGEDDLKDQLSPVIAAYNDKEDEVQEDFDGYKDYKKSYIDDQIQTLMVLEGIADKWMTQHPKDKNEYIHGVLKGFKENIARDRADLERNRSGKNLDVRQGLIHGTYKWEDNSADLHVDKKGDGQGFPASDMLVVAKQMLQKMTQRKRDGGPTGVFILHPTGAAIVKIMVQLLGEAMGDPEVTELAHKAIKSRKFWEKLDVFGKKREMSQDLLDPTVHLEHFEYLRSLAGVEGLEIMPILRGTKTEKEFNQNILAATKEGVARLKAYKQAVEDQEYGVSLNVNISAEKLPDVIRVLEG